MRLLIALMFVLSGCASNGTQVRVSGTGGEPREKFAYVAVDNRSWRDVRVYINGARLGFVGALTEVWFRTRRTSRSVNFAIKPMGEAETLFGPVSLSPGDVLKIQVALNINMTQFWVER
ncbi:hypothetical protein LCGC14_2564290 [marine sediment metagenome]|uniref:Uncharacterized protein n=1 Tax=marine sediment metagenome TaxID=412755 RepID=A0A0F9AJ11_9ZZZZ